MKYTCLLFLFFSMLCFGSFQKKPAYEVQNLGNVPKAAGIKGKARNIWDLQVFDDKIYLGYGSTTSNTGPTTLTAYDPAKGKLTSFCSIAAEAIERFRVWNDTLFIPNSDPTAGDALKFTYLVGDTCQTIRLDHKMAHVRDLYFYKGKYYLVGNTRCPKSASSDCAGLITMTSTQSGYDNTTLVNAFSMAEPLFNRHWNWFFGMLEVDDQLVIPNAMFTLKQHPNLVIKDNAFLVVNADSLSWSAAMPDSLRPKQVHFYPVDAHVQTIKDTMKWRTSLRISEHASYKGKTFYTLRTYSSYKTIYHQAYNNSGGLMVKDSLLSPAKRVLFPAENAVGEDIKVMNQSLFVLANTKIEKDSFQIYVYRSDHPDSAADSWKEVLHFESRNMARSFDYHKGYFYFGLGFNHGDDVLDAGRLVRIKREVHSG